jgi:hypothetical protein
MAAHDRARIRDVLLATMRLAGVPEDDESIERSARLLDAALADGPLLVRAVRADLEPMAVPDDAPKGRVQTGDHARAVDPGRGGAADAPKRRVQI